MNIRDMIVLDCITIYTIFNIPMRILRMEPPALRLILSRLRKISAAVRIVAVAGVTEGLSFSLHGVGVRDAFFFQFLPDGTGRVVAEFVVAVGEVGGCSTRVVLSYLS